MQTTAPSPQDQPLNLLADWISREQLAGELGLACDTLARWEARQLGPPCTRIGRKVLYRRTSVQDWISAQEQTRPARTRRGKKMNQLLSHPQVVPTSTTIDWMHDRLTEARGVLADTTQHPESLVILAARVVVGQTDDARECDDAIELLRLLDRRPLHAIAAAAFPKGGAA